MRDGMRALWRHMKPFKKDLWVLSALGLISAAANGFVPYITGRFFDALILLSKGEVVAGVWSLPLWGMLLAVWAIIQIIANNIDWVMDRMTRRVDSQVHFTIQAHGFMHLFRLPISFHKSAHIDGVLQKISSLGWRASAIVRTIIQFLPQLLSVLIGVILAASINGFLASVLLMGVLLYLILLFMVLRPAAAQDSAAHRVWGEEWNNAAEIVHQIESVKQAGAEEYEEHRVREGLLEKAFQLWYRLDQTWNNVSFYQRTIVFFTQLAVFIFSVKLVGGGVITVGELVALNGYALMFFGPFVSLGHSWQVIQNGITSAAHAEKIFEEPEEIYAPENAVVPQEISGKVAFNHVSFQYGEGQPAVLSHINFSVEPGEVVAFVGESGVGKSTAISLISGYYFPTKGEVLVDEVATRAWNLTALRKHIAVVPQEVALFSDTIKANIMYGTPEATDNEVFDVAKEAHIAEFIGTLPDGYNTIVGERGIKLSVGQKQRVAIARAMLRNPSILILDEPTSALDSVTEKYVTGSLEKLMKNRTTFVIAHRLSTVRKADRIFFIENGEIIEEGSHNELIKIQNGKYKEMHDLHIGLRE